MIPFLHTLISHPIIPAFLVANLAIGFWAHRKAKVNSFEDYALASRSLPTGVLVMTLLATFVGTGMLAHPDVMFFTYGILQFGSILGFIFSFLFIGTFFAPLMVYFDGCITLGDLMHKMYGTSARLFSGVISCLICLLMVTPQIQAIIAIAKDFFGTSPTFSILCFGGIVVAYSAWGGMRAVSYTDVLQAIVVVIVLGWMLRIIAVKAGGIKASFSLLPEESKLLVQHPNFIYKLKSLSFWLIIPVRLLTPPIVQRMLMTKDKKQVRKMWYVSAFFYALILGLTMLIGVIIIAMSKEFNLDTTHKRLLPRLVKVLFSEKKWVIDIFFIGVVALGISTMDSYLHSIGITIVQDLIEPIRSMLGRKQLTSSSKAVYAKIGIALIGSLAILIACIRQGAFFNKSFYMYSVQLSALVIIPLLIGILGIKTDKKSWGSFCTAYVTITVTLKWLNFHVYDRFLVAIPLSILAYFLAHLIQNRGIVMLKRSELTVAERLWLPSWSGLSKKVMGLVKAPLHLPTLADRKVVHTPMHALAFSMLIFGLYTLSSIFASGGGEGTAHFMAGIHFVGITLCCGLMLQGIWPASLKPYFPLYWFLCLFYCLPFGGTLSLLQSHAGVAEVSLWIAKIVFLVFLVDSSSFLVITLLGTVFPCLGWYLFTGGLPQDMWSAPMRMAVVVLLAVFLGILLFGRGKEARTNERLYWNRIASSILGHDLRGSTQMLGGAGNILEKTFEIGEPITNGKGEKGYWLPFAQSEFLAQFSTDMSKKAASTRKDISNFLSFIQSQIMGTFEQKAVSMRAMAEEGMEKIDGKVKSSRIKLSLETKQDFEAKVLSGIFPNVITNLLMNATTHGKASKITVTIDGHTRTVTVRDNGEGIPSDVLPRIFELSYSTAAAQGKENSGVGLAFVKMVLDTSDAKISCHSRTGKGSFTEFVMTFAKA